MDTYKYKAVDGVGRSVAGSMDAANLTDLEMRLSRMGLDLVHYREQRRRSPVFRFKRTSRHELINFSFHLEQLLRAGVPVVDALSDLGSTIDDPSFRDVVAELVEAIEGGRTFSEALSAFPGVFGNVYVSMVRVGEESGRLGEVLRDLASLVRRLTERVVEFSTLGVRNRVHAEVLRLARDHLSADNTAEIQPAPTHAEIASRVSTHREAVTRTLNRLAREGVIDRRRGVIIVRDVERLECMVEDVQS